MLCGTELKVHIALTVFNGLKKSGSSVVGEVSLNRNYFKLVMFFKLDFIYVIILNYT